MWGLKHKVGWALKNWYFHTVVMERLLRTTWTSRRSNQSILKEINSDYSLEGLMLKLKLQYFDHQMWKSNSGKDPDAEKDWGQDEKGTTEGEMIGWHHWLNGYEFKQTPGDSEGQGSLACCNPWDGKEPDMTERLQPRGLQHTRLPCLSLTPGACSNSYPLSQWCHPTISSSVVSFSFCLQSFPESGSFQMRQFFASGGQTIGVSASASFLSMNIQDWFPLG